MATSCATAVSMIAVGICDRLDAMWSKTRRWNELALNSAGGSRTSDSPRTWMLASPHQGDNSQLLAVVRGLGWPFEIKQFQYNAAEKLLRFMRTATLAGLDRHQSDELRFPGPDLCLLSGRSNEAVAFWIKRTLNPACKLVFVGTPMWPLENYDLVIAAPQYCVPPRPNVLPISLPLHEVEEGKLAEAERKWKSSFAGLPEPRIAVLVGGNSGPYVFSKGAAQRLKKEVEKVARERGGALLVTTSARTPSIVADILTQGFSVPSFCYRWSADGENPFFGILAHADQIVVSADSISMISEAIATGKPVRLFDTDDGRFAMRAEESVDPIPAPGWLGQNLEATIFRLLMRFAPRRWSRDLRVVHRNVIGAGLAHWLGTEGTVVSAPDPGQDLRLSLLRVRQLFGL